MITFFLPITPPKATSQSAGKRIMIITDKATGKHRPMFFKNRQAAGAEHDYLVLCAPHKPESPFTCPVRLEVDFVFPWRKSEPSWRVALGHAPMTTKPDLSNAIKSLEDCLTKLGFWNDDGQVSDLHITKAWGDKVGISVSVSEIPVPSRKSGPSKPDQNSLL